jgi:hypothetical protein
MLLQKETKKNSSPFLRAEVFVLLLLQTHCLSQGNSIYNQQWYLKLEIILLLCKWVQAAIYIFDEEDKKRIEQHFESNFKLKTDVEISPPVQTKFLRFHTDSSVLTWCLLDFTNLAGKPCSGVGFAEDAIYAPKNLKEHPSPHKKYHNVKITNACPYTQNTKSYKLQKFLLTTNLAVELDQLTRLQHYLLATDLSLNRLQVASIGSL